NALGLGGVAFRRDGRLLGSTSLSGSVDVWDLATGRGEMTTPLRSLKGHTSIVSAVAFSPDGKRLASASVDKTVKLWETATGQELLSLKAHTEVVTGVSWSADGQRLASAGEDGTVKVWEAVPPTPEVLLQRKSFGPVQ